MDNLLYNMGALLADIPVVFLFAVIARPAERRKYVGIFVSFVAIERLICGLTELPLEWTTAVVFFALTMVYGKGSAGSRVLRCMAGIVAINVVALVSAIPWMAVYGYTPDALRDEVSLHPEYFVLELGMGALSIMTAYVCDMFAARIESGESAKNDVPGVLFLSAQGVLMLALLVAVFSTSSIGLAEMILLAAAQAISIGSSLLFLRDLHIAAQAAAAEAQARTMSSIAEGYVRHFRAIEESIESTAMMRHDLRNQLQVVASLAQSGEVGEAGAMLDDLEERLRQRSIEPSEGLPLVDEAVDEVAIVPAVQKPSDHARNDKWNAVHAVSLLLSAALLLKLFLMPGVSRPALGVAMGSMVLWAALTPYLMRRVREAQQAEVAHARAKAAREQLEARVFYGRRIEAEVLRARELEVSLRDAVAQVRERVGGAGRSGEAGKPTTAELAAARKTQAPFCENRTLDALLALKASGCEQAGIRLTCSADVGEGIEMASLDLCALFSNALDNAMAACEVVPEGERWIDIAARAQAGHLVAIVRNSCAAGALPSGDAAPTLEGHGWGLRILDGLVRQHGGALEIGEQDGVFTAKMMLGA